MRSTTSPTRTLTVRKRNPLSLRSLRLPDTPRVTGIDVQDYVDSIGDQALRVTVMLEDRPDGSLPDWNELKPIRDAIFDAVLSAGDERFPYVRFTSPNAQ